MFRLLQGIPRALRNTLQVGYTTHHRSLVGTQQNNPQDEAGIPQNNTSLQPSVNNDHIVRLYTSASGSGDEEQNSGHDDWKSFKKHNHWQSFRGTPNHFEAVGWGTAIIISLQVCRGLSTFTQSDSQSRRHGQPSGMLTSTVHAMPMHGRLNHGFPTCMNVLDDRNAEVLTEKHEKPQQNDATEIFETSEELNEVFQKLKSVSDESVGMVHNALGLEEAKTGNLIEAAQHFLKGSVFGYSKAKFNMAVCYEQGKGVDQDFTKAANLYKEAAVQGHAMAQYNLGVFHLLGRGGAVKDPSKALELIIMAANLGLTQAETYLGAYYMQEPHQDPKKAIELLNQAAKKHDTQALFHLGICYEHGLGIECNTAKAASYYHKAASKGFGPALYSLATFYEQGLGGLPENLQQAKYLYRQASQKGCHEATARLEQLLENDAQKQSSSQNTAEQSLSKNTEEDIRTIKRTKSQRLIENPIHTSSSAPVLSTKVTSSSPNIEQQSTNSRILDQLSYLGLFLPYYLNASTKGPVTKNTSIETTSVTSQRLGVVFQVGEETEESEVFNDYYQAGVLPVSNLTTRNSALLTVT